MLGPAVRCCDTFTSRASGFHPSAALLVTYWTALGEELVSRLLHAHFKDDKTKVSGDSLQLMAELLKIFVVEAAVRAVRQAQAEDAILVDVDQLEKVLPQLLLDF
ncbi:centromere protein X isoform X15 [Callithrix jacchus]